MPDLRDGKTVNDRRKTMQDRGDKLYHTAWYGEPCKRPPSNEYRENYDQIKWESK